MTTTLDPNMVRNDLTRLLSARPDLTTENMAPYSNLASSTWRSFKGGSCVGGEQVVSEIARVLVQINAGDILPPGGAAGAVLIDPGPGRVRRVPKAGTLYRTTVVKQVEEVLNYCVKNSALGLITADFGVGKTEAVKAWRHAHPGVDSIAVEINTFTAGSILGIVREMANQVNLSVPIASQMGSLAFEALVGALRESPCLIIIDQCEMIRPRVAQVIRQVWDRTHDAGVGVCMLAAPIFLTRMNTTRKDDFGALSTRVAPWAALSGFNRGEMASILKEEKLTDVSEEAKELLYKGTAGSMRRLMRTVDLLRDKHAGKPIGVDTIRGVATFLWGMQING